MIVHVHVYKCMIDCTVCSCANINFAWRNTCNKCGKGEFILTYMYKLRNPSYEFNTADKGKVEIFKKTGSEIGKTAATKSGGLFSADDWQCSM